MHFMLKALLFILAPGSCFSVAGQLWRNCVMVSHMMKQAGYVVRLFFVFVVLSAHRIKDASPQLRLTVDS
jgi:hypothetical protein